MAFRHWIQREPQTDSTPGRFLRWLVLIPWKDVLRHVHLNAGVLLVVWGVEVVLPFTAWRLLLGFYVLSWFGWSLLWRIARDGIYLLNAGSPGEASE